MSKLMSVMGIVLLAIGLALGLVGFVNSAQMQVLGLSMDTAAILFTGGVLAVGLGGVIAALENAPRSVVTATVVETVAPAMMEEPVAVVREAVVEEVIMPAPAPAAADEAAPSRVRFNPFGRKSADLATGLAAGVTATAVTASSNVQQAAEAAAVTGKSAVDDTIAALEQAKADIANAVGGISTITEETVEETVEDEVEETAEEDELGEDELYVVEEREIRGRPARILSDNTVEAETDEGWMRFENLEHLNEYLDAMGEPA
jgi:hypothetical protein